MYALKRQMQFNTKLDLLHIRTTFFNLRRLRTAHDITGSSDSIIRVLLIGEKVEKHLREAVRMIGFASDESYWANSILQTRRFEDSLVLCKSEIPENSVWEYAKYFLCIELIDPNRGLMPGQACYIEMPVVYGYACKGYDYSRIVFWDRNHPLVRELQESGDFVCFHDPDESVWTYIGQDYFEYFKKSDRKNMVRIPMKAGKTYNCHKTGGRVLFCNISPQELFTSYYRDVKDSI